MGIPYRKLYCKMAIFSTLIFGSYNSFMLALIDLVMVSGLSNGMHFNLSSMLASKGM